MVGVNAVYDPLHVLNAPKKIDVYDRQARFGHVGIVRHTNTGDVFVGSSVFQDLDEGIYNGVTGREMTRIPVPGASPVELYEVLDTLLALNSETLNRVVIGMDFFVWGKEGTQAKWGQFPQYLYSDAPFVEAKYLGSFQIFSRLMRLMPDYYMLEGRERTYETRYRATYDHKIGRRAVFQHACKIKDKKRAQIEALSFENARANIEHYIGRLLSDYPDTKFVFMLPTYSILEYAQYQKFGKLNDFIAFREKLSILVENELNLSLVDGQSNARTSLNLDIFYDATHGGQEVLDPMLAYPEVSFHEELMQNSQNLQLVTQREGRVYYKEMLTHCSLEVKI